MTVNASSSSRTRRTAVLVAATLTILLAATGCTRELGGRVQELINRERAAAGLPALAWDDNAAEKAQAWAERLASTRTLAHSRLTDGISGGWTTLGENVGFARSLDEAHAGFMRSPKHRAAILDGSYSAVGVGIAQNGGLIYVVEVFRG